MSVSRSRAALHGGILTAVVLAGFAASAADAAPRTGRFDHTVVYPTTTGKVGYHFDTHIMVYGWDTPTGDFATCAPNVRDISVVGDLPPGLALVTGQTVTAITGTPGQPGDWSVTFVLGSVRCTQGADTLDYGPKRLNATFHIDP